MADRFVRPRRQHLVGHGLGRYTREEIGSLNLWFPISCGPGGSKWLRALPG